MTRESEMIRLRLERLELDVRALQKRVHLLEGQKMGKRAKSPGSGRNRVFLPDGRVISCPEAIEMILTEVGHPLPLEAILTKLKHMGWDSTASDTHRALQNTLTRMCQQGKLRKEATEKSHRVVFGLPGDSGEV